MKGDLLEIKMEIYHKDEADKLGRIEMIII